MESCTNLDWVLIREEVDNFESMGYNANSKELFPVVTTLHHQAIPHRLALIALQMIYIHDRTCPPSARR
jgi:hypothetical protein